MFITLENMILHLQRFYMHGVGCKQCIAADDKLPFANMAAIGSPGMFIYGGFVFLSVYAYTELMDKHVFALIWETGEKHFRNLDHLLLRRLVWCGKIFSVINDVIDYLFYYLLFYNCMVCVL